MTALAARRCGKTRDELIAELDVEDNGAFSKVLRELEECGFVARFYAPGRRHRDGTYQLVDNYTLFYFEFLHGASRRDSGSWLQISATQTGRIWCGFAFERVCLAHIAQMKKALGISGVVTEEYAWRHIAEGEDDKGAQIDLVIDRSDGVVNLCEMKYSRGAVCDFTRLRGKTCRTRSDIRGQGGSRQVGVHHNGHTLRRSARRKLIGGSVRDHGGGPLR